MESSPRAPVTSQTEQNAYQPKRGIIVLVESEAEQAAAYEQLRSHGFKRLRVVTA